MLSLICFVVGGILGWLAAQGGPVVQRLWPIALRVQILTTSIVLSMVVVWRLDSFGQLLGPVVLACGLWVIFGAAQLSRGSRSGGEAALESWTISPNSGFWVVPAASAFAGSAGVSIAVLANVVCTVQVSLWIYMLRRDAPHPQRRSTSWVDQSPILASVAGLLIHLIVKAPPVTGSVLTFAGPLLAFSGAALFAGSVLHPQNRAAPIDVGAYRRWAWLSVVRVGYYLVVFAFATNKALEIVAVLTGLSAPSFLPVQLSVLYGYRNAMVLAAVRWTWLFAPFGLGVAAFLHYR